MYIENANVRKMGGNNRVRGDVVLLPILSGDFRRTLTLVCFCLLKAGYRSMGNVAVT